MAATLCYPDENLRIIQMKIMNLIKCFEEEATDEEIISDLTYICEIIRDRILKFDGDSLSTFNRNNSTRMEIASALCFEISSVFENKVDLCMKTAVFDMLEITKLRKICEKIIKRKKMDLRKEKNFMKIAQSKLSLNNNDDNKKNGLKGKALETLKAPETMENMEQEDHENSTSEKQRIGKNQSPNSSFADITEIRREKTSYLSDLEININQNPNEKAPEHQISVCEPIDKNEINQTNQNLESDLVSDWVPEISQPVDLMKIIQEPRILNEDNLIQETTIDFDDDIDMENPDLDDLMSIKTNKRKKLRVITDESTKIHNYALRALELNQNIKVERVMVYKGPPQVVQEMTANYLMTNPGFGRSLFRRQNNTGLSGLFKRHLIVEKKEHKDISATHERDKESKRHEDPSKNVDVCERARSPKVLSFIDRAENLQEGIFTEKSPIREDLGNKLPEGVIEGTTEVLPYEIPQIERSSVGVENATAANSSHLMRKNNDLKDDPWTYTPQRTCPGKKWTEFQYVLKKLEEIWMLCDMQGIEKEISLKNLLLIEGDMSVGNYVTLLRVLDKLSKKEKLRLLVKNNDIIIASL